MSKELMMILHGVVGTAVLALFWRTMLAVKGSRQHKRSGRLYLILLLPLLISVVPITVLAAAEEGPARVVQLVFLALVVTTAGWTAWRAIRDRDHLERFRGIVFRLLAVALFASGLVLLAIGIVKQNVLTVGFSFIGVIYGGAMLGFLREPASREWWLTWHLNGAALLFAASHAAFVTFLARIVLRDAYDETVHGLTQIGTLAFAYGLRQWFGWRYAASTLGASGWGPAAGR